MDENTLIAFKTICDFVTQLADVYGKKHKPLKFYKRIISKTQIGNDHVIKKHITAFTDFCSVNKDAIFSKDTTKIVQNKISYSDKVYIDFSQIFNLANNDPETTEIIWKFLLTISAIVDPSANAKMILKKYSDEKTNSNAEEEFLTKIISTVENNMGENTDPMSMISTIMNSGILKEVMSDIGNKKLNINKLLGATKGMVEKMESQLGDEDTEGKKALGMLGNFASMMGNGDGGDPTQLMEMFSGLMSGMNLPK